MKKLTIILLFTSLLISQNIMTPLTVSTAGTIATQSRGDDVIGFNPANLGFEDNPDFSMSFGVIPIVPIPSLGIINNAVSIKWLTDYLYSGQYLDTAKKDKMFESFGEEGWQLNPLVYAKILGISSGNFAFSIGAEINSDITLPTSLLRFVMYGNKFAEEISISDVDGSVQAVVPFSLSYGFPLELTGFNSDFGKHYLGFGVKILWGVGSGEVDYFDGGFTTYPNRVEGLGTGKIQYSYDGFGLAFDAGWAMKLGDNITTNLGVQNLFGFINWKDKNTEITEYSFDTNIAVEDNFDEVMDAFSGTDTTYSAKGFTTDYPTYLIAGVGYDFNPSISLYLNYKQYFNEEYQFDTTPRISLATQAKISEWFPINFGIAIGGFEKFQTGIGFGLHGIHYHFDIGISQTGGLFNSSRGIGVSIGQKILF